MALKSPDEWERFIGEQIKTARIRKNLRQEELAARAGVSKSAVFCLENGKGSSVRTFAAVLNALGETAWLENLAPEVTVSPIEQMKLGKQRMRVRRKTGGRIDGIPAG